MIIDTLTEFADADTAAGAAATRNVGDVIPLSVARDIGHGTPVYVVFQIDTAPAGADTVDIKLVSDSTSTPATDGSATLHLSTGAIAIASMTAGRTFIYTLPIEGNVYEAYLGVQVTNAGAGALTALAINAFLTLDPSKWKAFADGTN